MGHKKENRSDNEETDRNTSQKTGRTRRWQSCRRFWPHCHDEHYRGHREAGTRTDRGEFQLQFMIKRILISLYYAIRVFYETHLLGLHSVAARRENVM